MTDVAQSETQAAAVEGRRRLIVGILRCPRCGGPSMTEEVVTTGERGRVEEGSLRCSGCGQAYSRRNGAAVMVVEGAGAEASPGLQWESQGEAKSRQHPLKRFAHRVYRRLAAPQKPFISGKGKLSEFVRSLGDGAKVIDIGSGSARRGKDVINLDVFPFPNVDVVFAGKDLPLRDGSIDGIVSTSVIEHVEDPAHFAAEMCRVLRPGGRVLVTVPFMTAYHKSPNDYQRYTYQGLEALFSRLRRIDVGVEAGPSSAVANILQAWIASFASNNYLYRVLFLVSGWLVQPIKYLDFFVAKKKHAHVAAAGLYFIGEKPRG